MRAAVVNCSEPHYNLGARKLADWLAGEGWDVSYFDGDPGMFGFGFDRVCLSVIFSWHAPLALDLTLTHKANAEVWCGGPGMFALANWWKQQTGLDAHKGLDWRFERQRGGYRMAFASRGCPVNCWFCIVPKIEGTEFTLDWDFHPAVILCDNNLSALPVDFQEHVIRRYKETATKLGDANSGFEPRTFDEGTYSRWREILKGPWRFAYDEEREREDVRRTMQILKDEKPRKKQVWTLTGNEPISTCYERTMQVLEWGGEPWVQYVLPLNWLGDPATLKPRHDWTYSLGRDFARFFNRRLWRSMHISEYKPRVNEPEPFKHLTPRVAA